MARKAYLTRSFFAIHPLILVPATRLAGTEFVSAGRFQEFGSRPHNRQTNDNRWSRCDRPKAEEPVSRYHPFNPARSRMIRLPWIFVLLVCTGCAGREGGHGRWAKLAAEPSALGHPDQPQSAEPLVEGNDSAKNDSATIAQVVSLEPVSALESDAPGLESPGQIMNPAVAEPVQAALTKLQAELPVPLSAAVVGGPIASPSDQVDREQAVVSSPPEATFSGGYERESLKINLPTALAMIGGQHPAVGTARWRVQQAYAQLDQSRVLWLPSIQSGFHFSRHDGNIQASDGSILDVNRSSVQYGLGVGAVAAGPILRPGLNAQFHLADAIFQPRIARNQAWAADHAAAATLNRQLRDVAVAYYQWLDAQQGLRILEATLQRMEGLSKLTDDFAETGQGLQADADRMRTELILVEDRLVEGRERIDVASARLIESLSVSYSSQLEPMDLTVLPLEWVAAESEDGRLISTALLMRPELKESQSLVAAACEQYERQKYAPLVPSLVLGFSSGEFGGGVGNQLSNVEGRYDLDAMMAWELRNLGAGEHAARRQSSARVQQAKFEKLRMLDQVAREVMEGHAQVRRRAERVSITRRAIALAESSYERNLSRIRDGEGLPLEVLQSVQALEQSQRAYLRAVIDHNRSQIELQYALGWPEDVVR